MSNETKPLTAGIPAIEKIFNVHGIENIDELTAPGTMALLKEAAQQTAALREKLTAYESGGHTLIPTTELAALRVELEAVKKEGEAKKNRYVELVLLINTVAPNMAEQFARHDYRSMWEIWQMLRGRLSSGETKELNAVKLLEKAMQVIRSLKLSMLAHPDHQAGSEFDDLTTTAENTEREISGALARLSSGETKPPEETPNRLVDCPHCRAKGLPSYGWDAQHNDLYCDFCEGQIQVESKPEGFVPGEQEIMPNLTQEQKNMVVKECVEKASEVLLRVFMFCDLKTHIETEIVNAATGDKYHLSFTRKEPLPASPESLTNQTE